MFTIEWHSVIVGDTGGGILRRNECSGAGGELEPNLLLARTSPNELFLEVSTIGERLVWRHVGEDDIPTVGVIEEEHPHLVQQVNQLRVATKRGPRAPDICAQQRVSQEPSLAFGELVEDDLGLEIVDVAKAKAWSASLGIDRSDYASLFARAPGMEWSIMLGIIHVPTMNFSADISTFPFAERTLPRTNRAGDCPLVKAEKISGARAGDEFDGTPAIEGPAVV